MIIYHGMGFLAGMSLMIIFLLINAVFVLFGGVVTALDLFITHIAVITLY